MQPSIGASYCKRIQDGIQDGALQYLRMYLSWVGMPSAVSLINGSFTHANDADLI